MTDKFAIQQVTIRPSTIDWDSDQNVSCKRPKNSICEIIQEIQKSAEMGLTPEIDTENKYNNK